MNQLLDRFGRTITYLRISVTDRCNLRCVYCMPPNGIQCRPHDEILSFEEIYRIVRVAVALGIRKVRITGGEPLVRKDLPELIVKLKTIDGLDEVALTTNGIHLSDHASILKAAGLDRINVSLDSLLPEKFYAITRGGELAKVLAGIDSALSAGFPSVKGNVVLMRGVNVGEVLDLASLGRTRPIHVRFIEYMPADIAAISYDDLFFSASDARDICTALGALKPVREDAPGVSLTYRIDGFTGTIGFISPMSAPFCSSCNKLRLTSDGRLKSCLHSAEAVDMKKAVRGRAAEADLAGLFEKAVAAKPESHDLSRRPLGRGEGLFSMCQIGG